MGLVLDTSALIDAERSGRSVRALLTSMGDQYGEESVITTTVVILELEHGYYRAKSRLQRVERRSFIDNVIEAIQIEAFPVEAAQRAAEVDAAARQAGHTIPIADLMIGATALHRGYGVLTGNLRHYRMIPGLRVVEM